MAEEAVDAAVATAGLAPARSCRTADLRLLGAGHYTPSSFVALAQARVLWLRTCAVLPPPLVPVSASDASFQGFARCLLRLWLCFL